MGVKFWTNLMSALCYISTSGEQHNNVLDLDTNTWCVSREIDCNRSKNNNTWYQKQVVLAMYFREIIFILHHNLKIYHFGGTKGGSWWKRRQWENHGDHASAQVIFSGEKIWKHNRFSVFHKLWRELSRIIGENSLEFF